MDTYNIDEQVKASWESFELLGWFTAIPSFQNTFHIQKNWPGELSQLEFIDKPRSTAVQIHVSEIQPTTYC